jgi:RNA methyltransferase, TrmH family
MPVVSVTPEDLMSLKSRGVRLLAAVGGTGATPAQDADFVGACALLIGNEGAGLGAEWMSMADERVTIPCPGPVESLNAAVAGSLLLYEASRQRTTAR